LAGIIDLGDLPAAAFCGSFMTRKSSCYCYCCSSTSACSGFKSLVIPTEGVFCATEESAVEVGDGVSAVPQADPISTALVAEVELIDSRII
jgi:hypothetical protein